MNGGASMIPRNRCVRDFLSHAPLIPMYRAASISLSAGFGALTDDTASLSCASDSFRMLLTCMTPLLLRATRGQLRSPGHRRDGGIREGPSPMRLRELSDPRTRRTPGARDLGSVP